MVRPSIQQAYTTSNATGFIGAPVQEARNPTSMDVNYVLYQIWVNTSTGIQWQLVSFTSTSGTVLANWVEFATSSTSVLTLTGNSGGTVGPSTGNINIVGTTNEISVVGDPVTSTLTLSLSGGSEAIDSFIPDTGTSPVLPAVDGSVTMSGSGSIQTVGGTNQLTTQLTGLTNHNVLVGAGTTTITKVAPSATSGVPLISQGSSSDPAFGTAVVSGGGTGNTSFTAYAPVCGGTTTTAALQSASTGISTSGFVLTSTGSSSLPSFQTVSASGAITTITGNSGGAESPSSGNFNVLGTGSITVAGTANTETVQLTGLTNHAVLVGAGTATITNVGPSATIGAPLLSAGASTDPAYSTIFTVVDSTARATLQTSSGSVEPRILSHSSSGSQFASIVADATSTKTGYFASGQSDTPLYWNFGMASTLSNAFCLNTANSTQAPEGGTICLRVATNGNVTIPTGSLTVTRSEAAGGPQIICSNTSNVAGSVSSMVIATAAAGTNSDAYTLLDAGGSSATSWEYGCVGNDASFQIQSNPANSHPYMDGTPVFKITQAGLVSFPHGGLASTPAASAASTLSLGTAYQNVLGYDVLLSVYLNITVNAGGTITCGVGPTNTPTAQTLLSGVTVLGYFPVTVYLPSNYYALITASGLTASIVGQQVTPV